VRGRGHTPQSYIFMQAHAVLDIPSEQMSRCGVRAARVTVLHAAHLRRRLRPRGTLREAQRCDALRHVGDLQYAGSALTHSVIAENVDALLCGNL
jgi:hypothetical protein